MLSATRPRMERLLPEPASTSYRPRRGTSPRRSLQRQPGWNSDSSAKTRWPQGSAIVPRDIAAPVPVARASGGRRRTAAGRILTRRERRSAARMRATSPGILRRCRGARSASCQRFQPGPIRAPPFSVRQPCERGERVSRTARAPAAAPGSSRPAAAATSRRPSRI